jgi:hypothetical protein
VDLPPAWDDVDRGVWHRHGRRKPIHESDGEALIRYEPGAQPPAHLGYQGPHVLLRLDWQRVDARDVLFRHYDDMALGGGFMGRERYGVLGVDPDASARYGAEACLTPPDRPSRVSNAVVCSRVHALQEALSAATIALEISSRNARVAALQTQGSPARPVLT